MNTNQKPKANTVSSTKTAECGVRLKNFCLSKVLCIFPLKHLRRIPSNFSYRRFSFWGKIKPPSLVRLAIHFSATVKTLVLGNLFKLFRFAVTELAWEVCDTSQLIWTVRMMRRTTGLQAKVLGSEHRWFSRPEFLSLETSYSHCHELSILRDRGRLDRAELPFDTAHGSLHDLPEENYFTPLFFARVDNSCQHALT